MLITDNFTYNNMNQRLIYLGIVAAAVIALAIIVVPGSTIPTSAPQGPATSTTPLVPSATPTPTPSRPPVVTSTVPIVASFSATGNLAINNPGLKKDTWYLVYEQQGRSAITQELQFTLQSNCVIDGVSKKCSATPLTPGARATVIGGKSGSLVIVDKLTILTVQPQQSRTIHLYYYNQKKDLDIAGNNNPACSQDAIIPVTREIPVTKTPIQDTINRLIAGSLTTTEKNQGFQTEFPNTDFKLKGANLVNGVLTLEFTEVPGFTDAGSCRVSLLWGQIRKTALQFPEVREVRFIPETLFQP